MENIPTQLETLSLPEETWRHVSMKQMSWYVSSAQRICAPEYTRHYPRTRGGVIHNVTQSRPPRLLTPCMNNKGYLEVSQQIDGCRRTVSLHRLVASAWVAGYEDGLTVNHIDGVKTNNAPENLEWVSLSENTKHQWRTGLVDVRGEASPVARLTSKQVVYMRRLYRQGVPGHTIDIIAGVSPGYTQQLCAGLHWKHLPE